MRVGGLRTTSRGKVALEAQNPIRNQACKKIGCGKGRQGWWSWLNAPQNALCKYMECDDTDAEALLIGGAVVDFSHGLDIAVDLTVDKDPITKKYAFTLTTSIPGLDDRITWTISSSFLTKVAMAAKEAADNLADLQSYMSIDNGDLTKLVSLLDAVGIDKDRTRDAISVSQFLSVFGVDNIGAFVHKVAEGDFDDLEDLKLVLPSLPVNGSCMHSSWATRTLPPLTSKTLFDIMAHNKTSFTIPPICKDVSQESEGWIKSVRLYDMEVADLFVRQVETGMDTADVDAGHREIDVSVTGISGNVGVAFKVNVWALGVIEAKVGRAREGGANGLACDATDGRFPLVCAILLWIGVLWRAVVCRGVPWCAVVCCASALLSSHLIPSHPISSHLILSHPISLRRVSCSTTTLQVCTSPSRTRRSRATTARPRSTRSYGRARCRRLALTFRLRRMASIGG